MGEREREREAGREGDSNGAIQCRQCLSAGQRCGNVARAGVRPQDSWWGLWENSHAADCASTSGTHPTTD